MNRIEADAESSISDEPSIYDVVDLRSELEAARISIENATGNGSSSGAAVEGSLLNLTPAFRRIGVNLNAPLHLQNAGVGQNMVAIQVFGADGAYRADGGEPFIELPPRERMDVFFISFCLEFDKENPTAAETFVLDPNPSGVESVLRRVMDHARRNPDDDLTVSGQVAVWLATGISMDQIREKFDVSASEERLARFFAE